MPRGKRLDDGHEANRAVRTTAAGTVGGGSGVPGLSSLSTEFARVEAASGAFIQIMARTDGWLRCIPAGEGKLSYFKYKFSSGEHKGKYVMYVAGPGGWTEGILGLVEKLDEVDNGLRKPAQDTFYDPR